MDEYNPLDYDNLTRNCVLELMQRGPFSLPLDATDKPKGAGVYALFYHGSDPMYARVSCGRDSTWPIYVGKAVLPGARKGGEKGTGATSLYGRIHEHTKSIEAAENLELKDFSCRYLVVTPLWITMAERFLITHFQPVWNVCIEGFGNHDPGSRRQNGLISWWDALHRGRAWGKKLSQARTEADAIGKLTAFMSTYQVKDLKEVLARTAADANLSHLPPSGDEDDET
ncbi:MAG: Eco29kI family restriction endonuclease [Vicinamibacteria bacterium]